MKVHTPSSDQLWILGASSGPPFQEHVDLYVDSQQTKASSHINPAFQNPACTDMHSSLPGKILKMHICLIGRKKMSRALSAAHLALMLASIEFKALISNCFALLAKISM
jgi:hypothetical protein